MSARTAPLLVVICGAAVGLAGCLPPRDNAQLPEVSEAMVTAAQKQTPDASAVQLQHGHDTMVGHCTKCHSMPSVDHESAGDWPGTMKSMAKKAKLGAEDEAAMLRYVLAAEAVQHKG